MRTKVRSAAIPGLSVFLIAAGLLMLLGCRPASSEPQQSQADSAGATMSSDVESTNDFVATNAAAANMEILKGKWLRPDGGYVIEIRQVDADGQLDAGYFNPNPIRVVSSVATKEGPAIKVRLELNDVGYPGCKYDLTYIPDQDVLVGTYFQAALGETFEVGFRRLN